MAMDSNASDVWDEYQFRYAAYVKSSSYMEAVVPSLEELAMCVYAETFEVYWVFMPNAPEHLQQKLGLYIPTTANLLKAVIVIGDTNIYWKRRTLDTWPYECHNKNKIKKHWKRYYVGKGFGEYIETLNPQYVDYYWQEKCVKMFSNCIYKLVINNLEVKLEDENRIEKQITPKFWIPPKLMGNVEKDDNEKPKENLDEKLSDEPTEKSNCKYCKKPYFKRMLKNEEEIRKSHLPGPWKVMMPCGHLCKCPQLPTSRLHLATFIGKLIHLRSLKIAFGFKNYSTFNRNFYADLNYHELYCLILCLNKLKKLNHLKIHLSKLDPLHSEIIINGCKLLSSLKILELTNCTLTDDCASFLYCLFTSKRNVQIEVLNLSGNLFTHVGVNIIMKGLSRQPFQTIKTLNLSRNQIGSLGAKIVARKLPENKNITTLKLSLTGMETSGIKEIAQALCKNDTLINLDTSCNAFDSAAEEPILKAVFINETLENWNISECGLQESIINEVKQKVLKNQIRSKTDKYYRNHAEYISYESINAQVAQNFNDNLNILQDSLISLNEKSDSPCCSAQNDKVRKTNKKKDTRWEELIRIFKPDV